MPLETLINAGFVDYLILLIYFVFVLGIGLAARHQVSDSLDFFPVSYTHLTLPTKA